VAWPLGSYAADEFAQSSANFLSCSFINDIGPMVNQYGHVNTLIYSLFTFSIAVHKFVRRQVVLQLIITDHSVAILTLTLS